MHWATGHPNTVRAHRWPRRPANEATTRHLWHSNTHPPCPWLLSGVAQNCAITLCVQLS